MTHRTPILLLFIVAFVSFGPPGPKNTVGAASKGSSVAWTADDRRDIRLSGVRILVPDMDKAAEFYTGVIGLRNSIDGGLWGVPTTSRSDRIGHRRVANAT